MKEKDIETLILGLDSNPTVAWKELQSNYTGGVLIMPIEETERRKTYKTILKSILIQNGVTPECVNNAWLCSKIKRILR